MNQFQSFKKEDFIVLRQIHTNSYSSFYFVLHLKTFYIFMMKIFDYHKPLSQKSINHEINFCSKYSNRCLTKFYGFVKNEQKITGVVYEFMSNGNLCDFFMKHKEEDFGELFQYTAMICIVQGVKYLHQNSLIHRDLKPLNIFVDHDFIPYLMDFDTI